MSNSRLKIFSFKSDTIKENQIENTVNEFLQRPEVIAEPGDIIMLPDDYTIVYITYKLRKKIDNTNKRTKQKYQKRKSRTK